MELLTGIALPFIVSFIYIWLKAFQQLNVMHHKTLWVMPVSLLMALCEVTIVAIVVKHSFIVFLPIGIGGGLGCILAMYNHEHFRKSYSKDVPHK